MSKKSKNTHTTTAPRPPGRPHVDLSGKDLPEPLFFDNNVQHFLDELAKKRFIDIYDRTIVSGRRIRLDDDSYHHYYLPYIQFQGWEPILNLNEPVFPILVKLFYANLKVERNEDNNNEILSLVSMVKGVRIRLTLEDIAKALAISCAGDEVFFTSHDELPKYVVEVDEYYNAFTYHETNPYRGLKGMDILPEYRILRYFISLSLSPPKDDGGYREEHFGMFSTRIGNKDNVDIMQGFILNSLVVKRRICLPYILVSTMEHTMINSKANLSLPFGALITKLLLAAGVDPDCWDGTRAMDKPLDKKAMNQLLRLPEHCSGASKSLLFDTGFQRFSQGRSWTAPPPPKRVRTNQDNPERVRMEEEQGKHRLDRIEREVGSLRAEMTTFFEQVRKSMSS